MNINPPPAPSHNENFFISYIFIASNFKFIAPVFDCPKIFLSTFSTDVCYNSDNKEYKFYLVTAPSWITLPTEHATQWVTVGKKVRKMYHHLLQLKMISNIKIVKMNYFIKENWFIQVLSYCFKSNEIVFAFVLQYYIIILTKLCLFFRRTDGIAKIEFNLGY